LAPLIFLYLFGGSRFLGLWWQIDVQNQIICAAMPLRLVNAPSQSLSL